RARNAPGVAARRAPRCVRRLNRNSWGLLVGRDCAAEHRMRAGAVAAVGDANYLRAPRIETGVSAQQRDAAAEPPVSLRIEEEGLAGRVAAETQRFFSVEIGAQLHARQ